MIRSTNEGKYYDSNGNVFISVNKKLDEIFIKKNDKLEKSTLEKTACYLGTQLHNKIEKYYTNQRDNYYETEIETEIETWNQFTNFINENSDLQIIGCEYTVADYSSMIAGTIDAIFKSTKTGKQIIIDWKRTRELRMTSHDVEFVKKPLDKYYNTNYWRYVFQLNIYAEIMRRNGHQIDELWIIQFHPELSNYRKHIVPILLHDTINFMGENLNL
tara:strand:- start:1285 stop:1932 length:648 start_codon:yes stop_codon:yes gene_type:complete